MTDIKFIDDERSIMEKGLDAIIWLNPCLFEAFNGSCLFSHR